MKFETVEKRLADALDNLVQVNTDEKATIAKRVKALKRVQDWLNVWSRYWGVHLPEKWDDKTREALMLLLVNRD